MLSNQRKMCVNFFSFAWLVIFACTVGCYAQKTSEKGLIFADSSKATLQAIKSSPAYAEIILRATEREAELEEFLINYTEDFPKVQEIRFELNLLQKETSKILAINIGETTKLTLALGKLIVRKIELEVNVRNLRNQYKDDHPEVRRAKRKVEIYEKAVKEILL